MKRKIITAILTLALCFAFSPILMQHEAHAAQTISDASGLKNFIEANGGKCTLNGNTVKLDSNVSTSEDMYFYTNDPDSVITLDMNGYNIISNVSSMGAIWFNSIGTLNITNESKNKSEFISNDAYAFYPGKGELNISNISITTLASNTDAIYSTGSCTVNISDCNINSNKSAIVVGPNGIFNLNNTDVFIPSYAPDDTAAIITQGTNSKITLNDCIIEGNNADTTLLKSEAPTGSIIANGGRYIGIGNCVEAEHGSVTLNGGTYSGPATGDNETVEVENDAKLVIEGNAEITGSCGLKIEDNTVDLTLKKCSITNTAGGSYRICAVNGYNLNGKIPSGYFANIKLTPEVDYSYTFNPVYVYAKPKEVTFSSSAVEYTGKSCIPKIYAKDIDGDNISSSFFNKKVNVSKPVKVGTYKVMITFKGAFAGNKALNSSYKIIPKKAAIKAVAVKKKAIAVLAKNKITATGGSAYLISYKIKGTSKWKNITTTKQLVKIKNLKKGKKYQIRICAYKKVSGKLYKGDWSAVKDTKAVK